MKYYIAENKISSIEKVKQKTPLIYNLFQKKDDGGRWVINDQKALCVKQ